MKEQYVRSALLLGEETVESLASKRVAVFGVGGVGGFVVEALARSGVGTLHLIDDDRVALSNINRQLVALYSTVGKYKVDVLAERVRDIDPDIQVHTHRCFFTPETAEQFDFSKFDYVVDAIDTVSAKIELVMQCKKANTPIICAMGAGNKFDPTAFRVEDLYKTSVCPLARVMRQELKKRGIRRLKVVYSQEMPHTPTQKPSESMPATPQRTGAPRRNTPGSLPFVPSVMGLILAGEVVCDLCAVSK